MNPAATRRRWRSWRALLLAGGAALALLALALPGAAFWRPAWYRPPSVDFTRVKQDERDLVAMLERVGERLAQNEAVELELDGAQVNRWIAARAILWPEAHHPDLGPFRDPYVQVHGAGRLRVGATASYAGWSAVISADCRVELRGDAIRLHCEAVRVGALPVASGAWLAAMQRVAERSVSRVAIGADGVVTAPVEWEWPNGKRRFRIAELTLRPGGVAVRLAPLGSKR